MIGRTFLLENAPPPFCRAAGNATNLRDGTSLYESRELPRRRALRLIS